MELKSRIVRRRRAPHKWIGLLLGLAIGVAFGFGTGNIAVGVVCGLLLGAAYNQWITLPPPIAPAGWYFDPSNPAKLRFWDGTRWTGHTAATPGQQNCKE